MAGTSYIYGWDKPPSHECHVVKNDKNMCVCLCVCVHMKYEAGLRAFLTVSTQVTNLYTHSHTNIFLPDSPFIQSWLAWDMLVTTATSGRATRALWDISVLQPIDNLPFLIDGRVDLYALSLSLCLTLSDRLAVFLSVTGLILIYLISGWHINLLIFY